MNIPAVAPHALHARFLRGLERVPDGIAIRSTDASLTYAESYRLALRWAGALSAATGGPPAAVGVLADKGVAGYLGVLAALFSGASVVPLSVGLPPARVATMLSTAGARVVLADEVGAALFARTGLDLPLVLADQRAEAAPALEAPKSARPEDTAYILFTSGSTGRPKGVPITHASLFDHFQTMDARYPDLGPQDVFSQVLEPNFDCAIFELFAAWGAGGTVCQVPPLAYLDLPAFLTERGVTVWFSTPSAISLLRRMGSLTPGALSTLRLSCFAGEALLCSDVQDWQVAADRAVIDNLYGPTELTLTVTGHRWQPRTSPERAVNGVVPIGAVYRGHDHLLLGPHGEPDPDEGELCITGPQMTSGYLVESDNAGRFLERNGRRWYRTGDRVRQLADGELGYLGRQDSQVQLGGMRIELAEVDHALRGCAEVTEAVTVTRPVADGLELVAFYTGRPAGRLELIRQLRHALPEAMIPRTFRHLAEFPLNANRKVDRLQLAATAATLAMH